MNSLRAFKFFDFDSTESVSNILVNPTDGDSLTIEVNDGGANVGLSISIEGKADLEQGEHDAWYTISAISLSDFNVLKKLTKSGLYMIPITGVRKIRMVSEAGVGDFKVYAISTR